MKLNYLLFIVFVTAFAGNICAGSSSGKLSVLADTLIKDYAAKSGGGKTTLAIFPFTCDGKLEKQRAGFAASEVMSHRFVAEGSFTVVERGEIGKLLEEQRLQSSGAVDSDTAVRLGKVLGAGVILLGNIQKVGGKYQVNARLVRAETSAVLVSGYAELDSEAFEEDARPYLNLVPDEQVLSVYFLYNFRHNSNDLAAVNVPNPPGTIACVPNSFNLGLMGMGIRYFPAQKVFLDFSGMKDSGAPTVGKEKGFAVDILVSSLRGLVGYKFKIGSKLNLYTGIGAAGYALSGDTSVNYITPTLQARMEYRLQSRIGISISAGYDLLAKVADTPSYSSAQFIKWARLSKLSFEPSVSLYF